MQSAAAFTASPSLPLLKTRKLSPKPRLGQVHCSSKRHVLIASPNVVSCSPLRPLRRSGSLSSSPSSMFRQWNSVPLRDPEIVDGFEVRATAVPESAGCEEEKSNNLAKTLELALLFGLWYLFNIYFNIYNKRVSFVMFVILAIVVFICQAGFWSAMASNLTNQSRNVLRKRSRLRKSLVALFMEGVKFTPAYLQSAGLNFKKIYIRSLLAAVCFHAYQQVSYMILQRVSHVTHSVVNCVKRVVVIVSSVSFFRTPVSPINALGTDIALAGVFLYSNAKTA